MANLTRWFKLLHLLPDSDIIEEINAVNLRRIRWSVRLLIPLHLLYILIFAGLNSGEPKVEEWRAGIMLAHLCMTGVALLLGLTARILTIRRHRRTAARVVTMTAGLAYLLFGVYLALLDQQIGSGITAFILAMLSVAAVLRLHPFMAVVLFTGVFVLFGVSVKSIQPYPEVSLSLQVNALFLTLLGMVVSIASWHRLVEAAYHRRVTTVRHNRLMLKNRELYKLAAHDPLTGLYNRMQFEKAAEGEVDRLRRTGGDSALIILDIDRFKQINDTYGHPVGDRVLTVVAELIRMGLEKPHITARLGGEEFAILLPGVDAKQAERVARSLCSAIRRHPFRSEGRPFEVTASFGVAPVPAELPDPVEWAYQEGDKALYLAKKEGGNRVIALS